MVRGGAVNGDTTANVLEAFGSGRLLQIVLSQLEEDLWWSSIGFETGNGGLARVP